MAGGVVLISPWPSHPYDGQCRRATILNMYTDPPFRRQGIARRLMQTMIGWCREQGFVHVTLHASDKGRPLYQSLGFEATNEMRLKLETHVGASVPAAVRRHPARRERRAGALPTPHMPGATRVLNLPHAGRLRRAG